MMLELRDDFSELAFEPNGKIQPLLPHLNSMEADLNDPYTFHQSEINKAIAVFFTTFKGNLAAKHFFISCKKFYVFYNVKFYVFYNVKLYVFYNV